MPFDHLGQKHPTGSCKIAKNSGFSRLKLVLARAEGPRDLVIGSNERSWSVDVPFDHFGQNARPEVVKSAKIAQK